MPLESSPENPQPLGRVVQAAKGWIDRMGAIWVEGQVIEINRRSGSTQFLTLRDTRAEVSASLTCSRMVLDQAGPLTEGTTVAAWVKPTLWSSSARFSFECRELRPMGEGRLLARLEQLKRMLQAEGLFDPARKRRLPFVPRGIGLVTGRDSAAERDVVTTITKRWPSARIVVKHALVQGPDAAAQVMEQLAVLDADPSVDVIIIARGGGSLEDLLPFSDEGLVRAVAAARTPVVSAIGHEPDSPILDLVADLRATTPTDAGKRVVPDAAEEASHVGQLRSRLRQGVVQRLTREQDQLTRLLDRPVLRNPAEGLVRHQERVLDLRHRLARGIVGCLNNESFELRDRRFRLERGIDRELAAATTELSHRLAHIRAMSPKATLERGYAILVDGAGDGISSVHEVDEGDDVMVYLADGTMVLEVRETNPSPTHDPSPGPREDMP